MNLNYITSQLERNNLVYREVFENIPEELIRWRQQPGKWNLLEIVCHLYDEERDDFRHRLKHVLETPSQPFQAIDPVVWVTSRNYSVQNFHIVRTNL